MSSGQPDGIGYAEQEAAVRALSLHYTAGRLDVDEFDERVRRARSSTTATELGAVFADLPQPHPSPADRPAPDMSGADDPTRAMAAGAGPQYPDTAQYPGQPYPSQPYPSAYPDQPYPDQPYPGRPYPGVQDPGGWYPGVQYPGSPYPGGYQYGAQPYGAPQHAGGYPPPGVPHGFAPGGYDPAAPYGRDPLSGQPYSDKQKIVAGLLQIFLPFGVGRFYTGDVGIGIAQLLVTFVTLGFGAIWSFVDGIVYLAGSPTDQHGRPLRS